MVISEHNEKTVRDQTSKQASSSKQTKKVLSKPKTDPLERKMQEDKQVTTETIRPKSWPNKIEVYLRSLRIFKTTISSVTSYMLHVSSIYKHFIFVSIRYVYTRPNYNLKIRAYCLIIYFVKTS